MNIESESVKEQKRHEEGIDFYPQDEREMQDEELGDYDLNKYDDDFDVDDEYDEYPD